MTQLVYIPHPDNKEMQEENRGHFDEMASIGEAWTKDAQDKRFKSGKGVGNSLELLTDLIHIQI